MGAPDARADRRRDLLHDRQAVRLAANPGGAASIFALDAYLQRIGLRGPPTLARVHRAHSTTIPFENLDPQRGVPVSLEPEDLARKLVAERRGGYCFEQNLLLKAALEALGAQVEPLLARVRLGGAGAIRPRTHLVLRVQDGDGGVWHADVGFGLGGLFEPLPFGPGAEHEQSGWRFRIVADGPELVLQTLADGDWIDVYGMLPEAVPPVDIETSNWWTATHPRSPFVTDLIASTQREDGTRIMLSDRGGLALTERTPASTRVTPLARAEVPGLLASRFGLHGFALAADGRIVPLDDTTAATQ